MTTPPEHRLLAPTLSLLWLAFGVVAGAGADEVLEKGQAIYQKQCAVCHGKSGQGVADKYDQPLAGEATVAELSALIAETMPEEDPESCVGGDALAVAAYVHREFFSRAAPRPRIRLARLTANQLRQSLADVYGTFSGVAPFSTRNGLRGQYFNDKRPRRDQRKIDRVDPLLEFDFADQGPGQGVDGKNFSVQWMGGLKVDATGRYEVVIRSSCAFVCYLGGYDREFINNHVQSGDKTEFRRSIDLTAGRVYPLKVELYQRKRKTAQPPARISLSWIPPHGVESIVPTQNLIAEQMPPAFALQAPLPADDRSYGYERGIAVNRQWDDSTTAAAIEFGNLAARELWPSYRRRRRDVPDQDRARLRRFLLELVETAFRGPLDDSLRKLYVDQQVDASQDDAIAIQRSLLLALKSPRFLYPLLDQHRSKSQRAANRLSLTLYDSLPVDRWLVEAAAADRLQEEKAIRAAAVRMLDDYRARAKMREMIHAWLNLNQLEEISKDADAYPDFDAALLGDLRRSLDLFVDEVVWSPASDYRQLTSAKWVYTNERLHAYYGDAWKPASSGRGMRKSVTSDQHAGLLAHPYLMSGLAYPGSTSPIHRGVFVIRYLLGRTLRPPQEAFTPLSADLHPNLTTRERVTLQTSPKNCQVCHAKINALGFTLENYDAVGRYRTMEGKRPVNANGGYTTRNGKRVELHGAQSVAEFLAGGEDAQRAFVERAFQHCVKQPPAAYGADVVNRLTQVFRENQFNIKKLLVEIAVIAAHDIPIDGGGESDP